MQLPHASTHCADQSKSTGGESLEIDIFPRGNFIPVPEMEEQLTHLCWKGSD